MRIAYLAQSYSPMVSMPPTIVNQPISHPPTASTWFYGYHESNCNAQTQVDLNLLPFGAKSHSHQTERQDEGT